MKAIPALLPALLVASGCFSSSYRPTTPGAVGIVWDDNYPAYVRDGKTYTSSRFNNGLEQAVSGNPAAESQARTFQRKSMIGTVLAVVGGGCAGWFLGNHFGNPDETGLSGSEVAVLGGCAVVGIAGAMVTNSAEANRWDAINIYNDGIAVGGRTSVPDPTTQVQLPGAHR